MAETRRTGAPDNLLSQPGKGLSLAFIGGLALAFDIPLIRLAASDPWLVMAARGFGVAFVALALYMLPRVKGAIVGYQWAHRMHGFDETSKAPAE